MTTPTQATDRVNLWLVAACAGLGMFLVAQDIAVNVALPTITDHFETDIQTIQWIIVSFVATRAGLAVAAGSFGDLFGLKRVFLAGTLIYMVAVTVIAFSPDLAPVFGLRVLQGIGSGSLYAVAPAIAGRAFSQERRGIAMGVTTAGHSLGYVYGTLGMGFLIGIFGWEAAFLARVPFCVVALVLGWLVLKEDVAPIERRTFDVVGAASLVAGMVSLVLALHIGGREGWTSPLVIAFLVATPVLLSLFVSWELRARWPVLDLRQLRQLSLLAACSSMFSIHLGIFVIWFIFPFYVADALGRGPLFLGSMMAVMAIAMSLAAPITGWVCDRARPSYAALFGTALVVLGLGWMSLLDRSSATGDVAVRIGLTGFGLGVFLAAAYSLALKALPIGLFGTGSGVLSLAQAMGSVVSVAVCGVVFALREDHHITALTDSDLGTELINSEALVLAFQDVFRLGAVLALVGIAVLLLALRSRTDNLSTNTDIPLAGTQP